MCWLQDGGRIFTSVGEQHALFLNEEHSLPFEGNYCSPQSALALEINETEYKSYPNIRRYFNFPSHVAILNVVSTAPIEQDGATKDGIIWSEIIARPPTAWMRRYVASSGRGQDGDVTQLSEGVNTRLQDEVVRQQGNRDLKTEGNPPLHGGHGELSGASVEEQRTDFQHHWRDLASLFGSLCLGWQFCSDMLTVEDPFQTLLISLAQKLLLFTHQPSEQMWGMLTEIRKHETMAEATKGQHFCFCQFWFFLLCAFNDSSQVFGVNESISMVSKPKPTL